MVLERFAGVLGSLGSSCGSRGVCRERLGRILGRLGGVQKAFWGVLGVSCMRLGGAFLTRLVAILGTSWGHLVLDFHSRWWLNIGMPSLMLFLTIFV